MFASGLGVEDIIAREQAGWTFRKTKISDQFDFSDARAELPEGGDMLFLYRKDGKIRFFTHASRPAAEPGDVIVSYAPSRRPEAQSTGQTTRTEEAGA